MIFLIVRYIFLPFSLLNKLPIELHDVGNIQIQEQLCNWSVYLRTSKGTH